MSEQAIEEPKKERKKLIPVTVISSNDETALVEYQTKDDIQRAIIPRGKLNDETKEVEQSVLDAGVPYGDDFEPIVGAHIAKLFRQQGIWTKADFVEKRQVAVDILISALVAPLIIQLADYTSEVSNG